jgi:hypothetical protein
MASFQAWRGYLDGVGGKSGGHSHGGWVPISHTYHALKEGLINKSDIKPKRQQICQRTEAYISIRGCSIFAA